MLRYSTPTARGRCNRVSKRFRPYGAGPLPVNVRSSNGRPSLQDDHYGPNESLFDRESVVDMVSTERSGASCEYDSDCENSDPIRSFTTESNLQLGPSTSTPIKKN